MFLGSVFFSRTHEYVKPKTTDVGRVGITRFALERLEEVLFVDVPPIGRQIASGDCIASLEASKSVAEVFSPGVKAKIRRTTYVICASGFLVAVNGYVVGINPKLTADAPAADAEPGNTGVSVINTDPEGDGWIVELKTPQGIANETKHLLTKDDYLKLCEEDSQK